MKIYLLSIVNELKSCMVVISVFLGIAIFIYGISCSVDYDMFHNGVSNITKELQLINYPHINEMVELILNIHSISNENGVGIYEVIESIKNNTYQELSDMPQSDKEIVIKLLENKPLSPISMSEE